EDLGGGLAQPALDLAQVGVGDAGELAELAQGHLADVPLLADELTEVVPALVDLVLHLWIRASQGPFGPSGAGPRVPGRARDRERGSRRWCGSGSRGAT